MDPRYKSLKFLSSDERQLVHSQLTNVATSEMEDKDESDEEKGDTPPKPKCTRLDFALLDYQELSDSNGSTPKRVSTTATLRDTVEKEIILYRGEESLDKSADPSSGERTMSVVFVVCLHLQRCTLAYQLHRCLPKHSSVLLVFL